MTFPSHEDQIKGRCVHFNGVQNRTCEAGVAYDLFRRKDEAGTQTHSMPCLRFLHERSAEGGRPIAPCELLRWPTDEEVAAEVAESDEALAAFLGKLASDVCPHCDRKIERKQQVGRCVYADPCGHRLYQGHA